MPDPWMPGLRHDPGRSAGYNAGRNRMFMAVDHDTGGTNSYEICKWGRDGYDAGLCQILLPKVGVPWQFCEIDAICYHAGSAQYGDYNPYGPGFEVERLQGEDLTPDQALWLGRINAWCESEWGLPDVHYWGPRFPAWGANFHGHVNHRDIHPNPDGLSPAEWGELSAPAPPIPTRGHDTMDILIGKSEKKSSWMSAVGLIPIEPGQVALLMQGAVIVGSWQGDAPLGVPSASIAWANAHPKVDGEIVEAAVIANVVAAHNKLLA